MEEGIGMGNTCISMADSCLCMTKTTTIKKEKKNTKELYKKALNDPDNHDGVVTHLEPDTLESEVKWALL